MKVLWFSVTPGLFGNNNSPHNGAGWIASLQQIIQSRPEIDLGIAFETKSKEEFNIVENNVTYYPINLWHDYKRKLEKSINVKAEEKYIIPYCLDIIQDFKPDIIQIFGSENVFGLICKYEHNIPIIIHLQGFLPAYYNARFPIGLSLTNIILSKHITLSEKWRRIKNDFIMKSRALREEKILSLCNYYMGRTHWDKSIVNIYNASAQYFYCPEALRPSFLNSNTIWQLRENKHEIHLVSTLSTPLYKGVDLALKTASLIKIKTNIKLKWYILGINKKQAKLFESVFNINANECGINFMGALTEDKVKEYLINTDIYIHTSYIENSPNSVCEAQILGVPIIAVNSGGVSSLIKDGETGFLIPANDPIKLADTIIKLKFNTEQRIKISENARKEAMIRHAPFNIANQLTSIYSSLYNKKKK